MDQPLKLPLYKNQATSEQVFLFIQPAKLVGWIEAKNKTLEEMKMRNQHITQTSERTLRHIWAHPEKYGRYSAKRFAAGILLQILNHKLTAAGAYHVAQLKPWGCEPLRSTVEIRPCDCQVGSIPCEQMMHGMAQYIEGFNYASTHDLRVVYIEDFNGAVKALVNKEDWDFNTVGCDAMSYMDILDEMISLHTAN